MIKLLPKIVVLAFCSYAMSLSYQVLWGDELRLTLNQGNFFTIVAVCSIIYTIMDMIMLIYRHIKGI